MTVHPGTSHIIQGLELKIIDAVIEGLLNPNKITFIFNDALSSS